MVYTPSAVFPLPGPGKDLRMMRPIEVQVWSSKGWTTLLIRLSTTASTPRAHLSRCGRSYRFECPTHQLQLAQIRSLAVGRPVQFMASTRNFNPLVSSPAKLARRLNRHAATVDNCYIGHSSVCAGRGEVRNRLALCGKHLYRG